MNEAIFLKTIAAKLVSEVKNFNETLVLVPNRRSALFLKKHLANEIKHAFIPPTIYSFDDFISSQSPLQNANKIQLIGELYQAAKKSDHLKNISLTDFLQLAQVILEDFNTIDLYLADSSQLFTFLSETKAMSLWGNYDEELSPFQKKYLNMFLSLKSLHQNFNDLLHQKGIAYSGMIYRNFCDDISKPSKPKLNYSNIWVCGLNALSSSEIKILKWLKTEYKTQFFWDFDELYLSSNHEAGWFYKTLKREGLIANDFKPEKNFQDSDKKINIIGCTLHASQTKYAGDLLNELKLDEASLEKTAIVLNDESLLLPLLHNLPSSIGSFNISMGISLSTQVIYSWFISFLRLHEHSETIKSEESRFFSKDILSFLQHPASTAFKSTEKFKKDNLLSRIQNTSTISLKHLLEYFDSVVPEIYTKLLSAKSKDDILDGLESLVQHKKSDILNNEEHSFELEILYHIDILIIQVREFISQLNASEITTSIIRQLMDSLVQQEKIRFHGEPLKGLQILGLLETRALDFENIIMLSANEGSLPSSLKTNSFLPFEVRKTFGLPLIRQSEAVIAYHFYRLLQRSDNTWITYNSELEGLFSGGRSRFLEQLITELPDYNNSIKLEQTIVETPLPEIQSARNIQIQKTDEILSRLDQINEHGFSPTAIQVLINCSLQYYYKYVLKLEETTDFEELLGPAEMGSLMHNCLEILYKPYESKPISSSIIDQLIKKTEDVLRKEYSVISGRKSIIGHDLISYTIALSYLTNFFKAEKAWIKELEKKGQHLIILELESEVRNQMSLSEKEINFRGHIDRIDQLSDGTKRIIDYKTGSIKSKKLPVEDIEEIFTDPKDKYKQQLLLYYWMMNKGNQSVQSNEVGLISLRNISNGFIKLVLDHFSDKPESLLEAIEDQLSTLIGNLFSPAIPFEQTDEISRCQYCPYTNICNRVVDTAF